MSLTFPLARPVTFPLAHALTLDAGNPFARTDAILGAGGLDYALYDSGLMSSLFQDAGGTTPATLSSPVGRWNARQKPPHYASQTFNASRPILQSDGLKFDGSDDNLLTDWFAQAGANCIIAQVTVPAIIPANCFIAGLIGASGGRFRVGVLTNGLVQAGVGDQATFTGATLDTRGQTVVIALTADGVGTAKTFAGSTLQSSVSYTGAPATNVASMIGATNGNGTPQLFFPGSVKRIAFGKVDLDLAEYQAIEAEWLAAA